MRRSGLFTVTWLILFLALFLPPTLSAQTLFSWRYRSHATDCTTLPDGKSHDLCLDLDDFRLWTCVPDAGDCTGTEWKLSGVGFNTSAQLATLLSDETGTGAAVFAGSPTFTGQVAVAAGSAGAPGLTTTGDTNTGMVFPVADTIALSTGGVERVRVDSSGRVGIKATPSFFLHMGDTTTITQAQIGGNLALYFMRSNPAIGFNVYWDGTQYLAGSTGYVGALAFNASSGIWTLQTSTASIPGGSNPNPFLQRFTIMASTGNFGVSDITPDAQLDVVNLSASQPILRLEHPFAPTADYMQVDSTGGTTGTIFKIDSVGRHCIGCGAKTAQALLDVTAAEAIDAVLALDADDGDDLADTWLIKSVAASNNLDFVNHTTVMFSLKPNGTFFSTPLATAPATCAIGDFYVDTSGGYCACTIVNTWLNMVATGTCV